MDAGWVSICGLLVGVVGLIVAIVASWDKLVKVPWGEIGMHLFLGVMGVIVVLSGIVLLLLPETGMGGITMVIIGILLLGLNYFVMRDR